MTWRVSHVEAFRQWEADEDSEVEDLFSRLRGDWPESPAMAAGTAFHKALELGEPGEFHELVALGHRFVFADDFKLTLTPIRELRGTKMFTVDGKPIFISGQVDAMDGLRIEDHKTTSRFDPDRYLSGCQWRLYLDIFGAKTFRWNVFELTQIDSDLPTFEVRDQHRLEQFAYPRMREDNFDLVTRFARFVRDHEAQIEQREAA